MWNCKGETPTGGASFGHLSGCFLQDHPQTTFSQTAAILRRDWHHDDQAVGKADASELHCPCRTGELHSRAQLWCLMRGSPRFRGPPLPRPGALHSSPGCRSCDPGVSPVSVSPGLVGSPPPEPPPLSPPAGAKHLKSHEGILSLPGDQRLRSGCPWAGPPAEAPGEGPSHLYQLLGAPGVRPWDGGRLPPVSASVSTWLLLCVRVSPLLCLIRTFSLGLRPPSSKRTSSQTLHSITSADTLLPCKAIFCGSGRT